MTGIRGGGAAARDRWRPFASRLLVGLDHRRDGTAVWARRPGTLLKVDVTGFTRLTERLARAERTGAEELNVVLTEAFTGLVAALQAQGGDVVQFGGDALAVWFEGDGHAGRAAAAARDCHRWLRSRAAIATPAGPVRLRASAGIASGEVLFGVVGQDHRELIALGPVVTAALRAEAAAASGRTVVADTGPVPGGEPAGADHRTHAGPARLPAGRRGAARRAVPPAVRPLVLDGESAEHRRAAAAFVGLVDVDALVDDRQDAQVATRVERCTAAVEEACADTGVTWTATDLAVDGPVWLLYAGAPVTSEHDADRMLHALDRVLRACGDDGARAGAHAGRVYAGVLGSPDRRTWAALGDATNTAARLMGRAARGEALVSADLVSAADPEWDGERVRLPLKGKRGVVTAVRLIGSRGRPGGVEPAAPRRRAAPGRPSQPADSPAPEPDESAFVGRDDELAEVVSMLSGEREQDARRALLLVGPAGIGKTRLIDEALRLTAGAGGRTVLRARATPVDRAAAYAALRPGLRTILGRETAHWRRLARDAALDPGLVPLLGLPLGIDVEATPRSRDLDPALVAGVRDRLLARLLVAACVGPLVVIADDGALLDRGSLGLLDALRTVATDDTGVAADGVGAAAGIAPVVVVALRDPPGTGSSPTGWPADPDRWRRRDLGGLPVVAVRRLVVAGAGPLDDVALESIVAECGGNPLFARELARLAAAQPATGPGVPVPESVEGVIAARVDLLPAAQRRLLREASVAGTAPLDVLATALDRPALAGRGAWRGLSGFVTVAGSPPTLRFDHDLYRRGAYEGLPVRRRRALHAALADLLVQRGADPATVAAHAEAAGRTGQAAVLHRSAGQAAARAGAWGDALRSLDRAWECGRRAGRSDRWLAGVAERRAEAADLVGRYEAAEAAWRAALRLDPAAGVTARTRRAVARAAAVERQGRYRSALRLLTAAERDLPDGRSDVRWPAVALRRSSVLYRLGRLRASMRLAVRVADHPEVRRGDRARALLRVEMCASELGLPDRGDWGLRALRAFRGVRAERDLASLLGNLGVTAWETDDWDLALRRYRESEEAYRRAGDAVGAAISANNAAEVLFEQGRVDDAKALFQDAERVFRASGHAFAAACTASSLGRLAARSGDTVLAAALLDVAEGEFRRMESPVFVADTLVRRAELALLRADPAAERRVEVAEEAVRGIDVGRSLLISCARYRGLVAWAHGDDATAIGLLRQAAADAHDARALHEETLCLDALLRACDRAGPRVLAALDVDAGTVASWAGRRDAGVARLGIVTMPALPPMLAPRARAGSRSGRIRR